MTQEQNQQQEQATEQTQAEKYVWQEGDIEIKQPEQDTQEQPEFKLDGRTKRALDIAISKKQISQASYKAVVEGRIDLTKAKELGREGSPDTSVGPAVRVNKNDRSRLCMCQCGRETKGGRFIPGHDQRLVTYAKEYVRGERELTDEQMEYVESSGKLERAKARVAEDEAKRQAKIAAKAEAQRAKEGEAEAKKRNGKTITEIRAAELEDLDEPVRGDVEEMEEYGQELMKDLEARREARK